MHQLQQIRLHLRSPSHHLRSRPAAAHRAAPQPGLVLNFRDHPILQNTNVLKPDWVTQGIYALLSDETLKTVTKGILTPADLSRILDSDRYPKDRHTYLTELMQEFQLCFPISAHTYLIPGLLPKEEPADTALEGDTLDFQYHYRILPESILSRFIVLTHDKIHQHAWRSGVMLAHTEGSETCNIARIKADPEDKKIFISISGREATRRSFLFLIRDTFQKIHRSFANPDISEWVPVPGHPDHPPLDYQELLGLEEMGDRTVPIGKLKLRVDLRQLLDGYESIEARQRRRMGDRDFELGSERAYRDMVEITKYAVSRPINVKQENNPMSTTINQNHSGSGDNVGHDKTVNYNASTAELLQLIATLRQTATQFPPELQTDITIDLDDVEAEVKKPENQRNFTRLKKRLAALALVGATVATPIAGITDFANNAIDLGSKLGIELQLPPAP